MHALSRPLWAPIDFRTSPVSWLLGLMAFMQAIGTPQGFPLKDNWLLSRVFHDGMRQTMTVVWVALCAWALWPRLVMPRCERGAVVLLSAVSLIGVNLLKKHSLTSCPWDLQAFGGAARRVLHWGWGVADGGPGRGVAFFVLCLPWIATTRVTQRGYSMALRWPSFRLSACETGARK